MCSDSHLPVYTVAKTGIARHEAHKLAEALDIDREHMSWRDGLASFVDPEKYLAVPTVAISDQEIVDAYRRATTNHHPDIPIELKAIDYAALRDREAITGEHARSSLAAALESAVLTPERATPVVSQTMFRTVAYSGDHGAPDETRTVLATNVSHRFTLDGYLLVGPGAQLQASYGHEGGVTRLLHSTRDLTEGASVAIIPAEVIRGRFSRFLQDDAELRLRLVYWAPPLRAGICSAERWSPAVIIPWYAVTITRHVLDPKTHEARTLTSRVHLVPATDDARFVPSVTVTAAAPGRSRVEARASASGGTPPYTYLWAGSNPHASGDTGASIAYEPLVRDFRRIAPDQSFERIENVCVTVVDANGVRVQGGESVHVRASPAPESHSAEVLLAGGRILAG